MHDQELIPSMKDMLLRSDLSGLGVDFLEQGIDSLIESETLSRIPVVGLLTAIWKTKRDVHSYLLLKKIVSFLYEFKNIPEEDRETMVCRLEKDDGFAENVGEQVILLLDRLDHFQKPALIARAFRSYVEGKIDVSELNRLNSVIDQVVYGDLRFLGDYLAGTQIPRAVLQSYAMCGLVYVPEAHASTEFRPTETAKKLYEHILKP